jgi:hypothetical protein
VCQLKFHSISGLKRFVIALVASVSKVDIGDSSHALNLVTMLIVLSHRNNASDQGLLGSGPINILDVVRP